MAFYLNLAGFAIIQGRHDVAHAYLKRALRLARTLGGRNAQVGAILTAMRHNKGATVNG
jgi:hypothetical protein